MDESGLLSQFADSLPLILLIASLPIFVWLTIKSKSVKRFQFQISIFIVIMIVGEIVGQLVESGLIDLSPAYEEIGYEIHLSSMIFFSLMIWIRFYKARKSGKTMIEEIQE